MIMDHETKYLLSTVACAVFESVPVTFFLKYLIGVEMNIDRGLLVVLSLAGFLAAINAWYELDKCEAPR